MKHIEHSPIKNASLEPYISCKDHTVSKKDFSILIDRDTGLLITSPRPENKDLPAFYESEAYISHSNSKKTLLDKIYQRVRKLAIKRKLRLLNGLNYKKRSLLEVGTGTGEFLAACKRDGWQVSGVEPNPKARERAEELMDGQILEDLNAVKAIKFQVITLWHVLEHMPELKRTIEQLKSLLAEDGTLIIAVPNHRSYDAHYYKEHWAAFDVPRHLWHFSKRAIDLLCEQEGLKLVKTLPMKFDAYYVSLLSEKYKNGRTNILMAFLIGLWSNFRASSSGEHSSLIYLIKKA